MRKRQIFQSFSLMSCEKKNEPTKTGEQFIIKENELRTDAKGQIYKTAIQNDIPYTERAK